MTQILQLSEVETAIKKTFCVQVAHCTIHTKLRHTTVVKHFRSIMAADIKSAGLQAEHEIHSAPVTASFFFDFSLVSCVTHNSDVKRPLLPFHQYQDTSGEKRQLAL